MAVIKVASGSYKNSDVGLPSSNGLNIIYDTQTGFPLLILNDEGLLTDIRTAAAGALVAQKLIHKPTKFSIIGAGGQAYFQAIYTCKTLGIHDVYVFGRSDEKVNLLKEKLARHQIRVINQHSIKEACLNADLITSVTPSTTPLIDVSWLNQNVHINAFGSDTKGKRELSPNILETADLILCDSLKQCLTQGELQYLKEINNYPVPIELGEFFINDYEQINGLSVCDFTGVAIQDIKLSEAIFNKLSYEDN